MRAIFLALGLISVGLTLPARADQLSSDKTALMACIADAFPEGEIPAGGASRKHAGDCVGLIERSTRQLCRVSPQCVDRETKAWLSIAREIELDRFSARNKALVKSAVAGIETQARKICVAAAAVSAWGSDRVAKEGYRVEPGDLCLRDAVAGMVVALMGHMRGK